MKRALWIPLVAVAFVGAMPLASHGAHPSQMCLDLVPEHTFATSNDDVIETLQAYPGTTDAGHPPEHEGCVTDQVEDQDWGGTTIYFEILEDEDGDDPSAPDMQCEVPQEMGSCRVSPPEADDGTQTIRGWISTLEVDAEEEADDEDTDATDVVLWHWDSIDPGACEPNICGPSEVNIRYRERRGTFRGAVFSPRGECARDRTVKLRKARRGPDRTIDVTVSGTYGDWRMRGHRSAKGRFYAVVTRDIRHTADPNWNVDCFRDESRVIRVP